MAPRQSVGPPAAWKDALHQLLHLDKLESSRFLSNSIIQAAGKRSLWQLAPAVLEHVQLAQLGSLLDSANYNAAIACLGKGQEWKMALEVLKQMPLLRVDYTHISFGAAISAFDIDCG